MSKLIVTYDASEEINQIIRYSENHSDLKMNDQEFKIQLQKMFQECFMEGRKFQKQVTSPSSVKDSISSKMEI